MPTPVRAKLGAGTGMKFLASSDKFKHQRLGIFTGANRK